MTDQDEQQRQADMLTTARELGLIDLDLLALTRKSVPAKVAVQELYYRYPAAFRPTFDARTATEAERKARWAEIVAAPGNQRRQDALERLRAMGHVKDMSPEQYREAQRLMKEL